MAKKLIVSDLDGTLLDYVDKLSDNYTQRLNKLIKKGIDFIIATGRDFEKAKIPLTNLELKNPIILTNGAILTDYPSGKVLNYLQLNQNDAREIIQMGEERNLSIIVIATFNSELNEPRFIKGDWWTPGKITLLQKSEYTPFLNEPIITIQYCAEKKALEEFYEYTKEKFDDSMNILFFEDAFLPGKYWLEYNPIDAKKETMLDYLIKLKGYDPKDVWTFGDQINDIGMFKIAGLSCAVENAPEEVKKIADIIIPNNLSGGVISFLEEKIDEIL